MSTVFDDMTGSESKGAKETQPNDLTGKARPARLCYVDDSRTSAYVVKRMLKPYGYVVDHFESAEPALFALIQDEYDLLLTDLKVSPKGMDGDDLVRTLRASGHTKIANLPVIVITGATDTDILAQVYEAGANQIMTKPVNGVELDAHIRKLVFEHKHGSEGAEDTINNVVPFAHDIRNRSSQDNIPTLNAVSIKPTPNKVSNKNEIDDPDSSGVRRVIRPAVPNAPHPSLDSQLAPGRGNLPTTGVPTPRPNSIVKPAPKVKPSIRKPSAMALPKSMPGRNEETSTIQSSTHAAAQKAATPQSVAPQPGAQRPGQSDSILAKQAALRKIHAQKQKLAAIAKAKAQAAAKLKGPVPAGATAAAKPTAAVTPTANKVSAASGASVNAQVNTQAQKAKKPIDPRVLAKIKAAAAAKKAKLVEQQKSRTVSDTQKNKVSTKDILLENADHLTLEPIENESVSAFTPPAAENTTQPQFKKTPTKNTANTTQNQTTSSPFQQNTNTSTSSRAAQDYSAQSAQRAAKEDLRPKESVHASSFFENQRGNDNIFDNIDRYPLVQADYSEQGAASKVVTVLNSIVELYGPKKVAMIVVMLLGLFVFYNWMGGIFDSGVAVDVTSVEQGEIFQSITVPGKVVSKLRVDITPSIAGRLTNIYMEEGDTVKKGELLARLDDREAKSNVKRAETNLENASQDVALADRSLKRLQQAYEKGAVAHQLVEEAEVELRSARARESVADEELRTAKLSLENPRIVAPFSGTVTARYVEVGQWVVPSETLFTLVDQTQREIEVQVDAADSGGIAVGQTVTLSSDAFPGLNWTESVTRLAAATSNVGNANTVSVYISLGSNAPSLRFGQQVDAEIRTAWNPSALKVPYGAIINRDGKTYVAVIQQDSVRLVEVETGIEDFSHVEIRQGVSVGQTVILANGLSLEQGDHVYIATK